MSVPLTGDGFTDRAVERFRDRPGIIRLNIIADFCGVSATSVARWYDEAKPLGGLITLKLWYFMEAAGYKTPELHEIRQSYPVRCLPR